MSYAFGVAIWGAAHLAGADDPFFHVPPVKVTRFWNVVVNCVSFVAAVVVCDFAAGRFTVFGIRARKQEAHSVKDGRD